MIGPICKKGETSVVDSRPAEDGTSIRRKIVQLRRKIYHI